MNFEKVITIQYKFYLKIEREYFYIKEMTNKCYLLIKM